MKRTRTKLLRMSLVVVCWALMPLASWSLAPSTINYRGTITDGAGQFLATGNYCLEFEIHDAAIDGSSMVIFCSRLASARSFSMCLNSS